MFPDSLRDTLRPSRQQRAKSNFDSSKCGFELLRQLNGNERRAGKQSIAMAPGGVTMFDVNHAGSQEG